MIPWYETAFGSHYLKLYANRDGAEAARVLNHLFDEGELRDAKVLDIACGAGRYFGHLRGHGAAPVGIDLSMPLLSAVAENSSDALLARADMRRLPFPDASFDWALSMFTSFGYFETAEEHADLAAEFARVARRGIIVDVPNKHGLARKLQPESQREISGHRVEERRRLEDTPSRVSKHVRVLEPGGAVLVEYEERVMLFERKELESMFAAHGFEARRCLGDYDGNAFDAASSPRLLLRLEREGL